VPVRSTGWVVDPDDESLVAAVLLDTAERPEVADLARVTAAEGVGDLRCGVGVWDLGPADDRLVRLEVAVDHPVHCRFHVVLPWVDHAEVLRAVSSGGALALGSGDGEGEWLVLNVDPQRLQPVIDLLDRQGSPGREETQDGPATGGDVA
jgi:hypothetical protein